MNTDPSGEMVPSQAVSDHPPDQSRPKKPASKHGQHDTANKKGRQIWQPLSFW